MSFNYDHYKPQSLFSLEGRTAIVTGGGTGIGLAQAQGLAAAGAKVYLLSRRGELLEEVVKKYNFAGVLEGDVTSKDSIEDAVRQYSEKEQWLDILVSNAGGPGPTHFGADTSSPDGETDPAKKHEPVDAQTYKDRILKDNSFENWDDIFRLNSHSLLFLSVAFLPLLAKGSERGQQQQRKYTSTIIATTSISAFVKQSQMHFAYNASKASAAHLVELISYELTYSTKAKVRVNSVAPGVFPSQMTTDFSRDPKTSKSRDALEEKLPTMAIPAGRHGEDEEMAGVLQFLAANEYMHGQIVALDGGFMMSEP
ncbi:NAD(P)-binding protein [Microstroma glucosiphilum]|uniref:NAD(P)-binding protein n=1 Tax=Pseudomicrostroma glucosiphilum TaxID=1684307 RepID=A0A316U1J2_9BASI|nr:NAD(P)-binding protein [Pseudomicrostroma glucosiphilum]PWN19157.1 NAD(P)-binding protein [Pseudomicrostroma glucosiphilum]